MKQFFYGFCMAAFILSCTPSNPNTTATTTTDPSAQVVANKLCVKPPLANINVAPQIFTVNPSAAKRINIQNGGSIEVPAAAFVHQDGRPVTEPVALHFKEFHSAGEIIASGIPMKAIGPDGQEGLLQTAGMFQMEGFVNNTAVKIAPGKQIQVNLSSNVDGRYDTWFFDTEIGNWIDIGDSDPIKNTAQSNAAVAEGEEEIQMKAPTKPALLDKSKPKLNFEVNYDRFPELKSMQGMVLQFTGSDKAKDPATNQWIFTQEWEDIKLEPSKTDGQYILSLQSEDKNYSIPVNPCLTGAAYEVAMRDYQQKMTDYQKSYVALSDQQRLRADQNQYLRSVGINTFGIYNYDIFWKQPDNVQLIAGFDFEKMEIPNDLKNLISVYLVCKGGTMVVGYAPNAWEKFAFNPNEKDNTLLAVLPDQKVAVITESEFRKLIPKLRESANKNYTFSMAVQTYTIKSPQDLDRTLSL